MSYNEAMERQAEQSGRAGHASHPKTMDYASGLSAGGGQDAGGYDGAQDAFDAGVARAHERFGMEFDHEWQALSWAKLVEREPRLDCSGLVWHSKQQRDAGCDWKIFMEIYFDDYHVEPFHPGLSSLADCGRLEWLWEDHAQAQRVGAAGAMGSSAAYDALRLGSAKLLGDDPVAAVWAACYPGVMVEWLSGAVAISRVRPTGQGQSVNEVDFLYPKGLAESNPEWIKAHQDAYWETALEDDRIAEAIQAGRDALALSGRDESGPAHPHLEAGVIHFHDWLGSKPWRAQNKAINRKIGP